MELVNHIFDWIMVLILPVLCLLCLLSRKMMEARMDFYKAVWESFLDDRKDETTKMKDTTPNRDSSVVSPHHGERVGIGGNCRNCGAPLRSNRCEYCGTVFYS